MKRLQTIALLLIVCLGVCGCAAERALSEDETAAFARLFAVEPPQLTDITDTVLTKERTEKFPAVVKVYETESGDWAVISEPVAYNGPVTLAIAIDASAGETIGMEIVSHMETDHYVRDMENEWFTARFAEKNAQTYLRPARLRAESEADIVCITGATVTTEGIVNGVNAAMGLFCEAVRGMEMDAVPLKVRFEPDSASGPQETGSIAIRAYGVVLGEVSLDEIRAMPSVKRTMSIHSSQGVTQHSFRGTLLVNVLDALDPALKEEYDFITAVGVDDYAAGIRMEEVRKENGVFLMYEDNDEPLPRLDGSDGAMRVVVLDDVFGQRFTNYMLEIVLEKDEM